MSYGRRDATPPSPGPGSPARGNGHGASLKPLNLDHLILRMIKERDGEGWDYALNQFLSKEGRTSAIRVASDYSWTKLQEESIKSLTLADDETFVSPNFKSVGHITDQRTFVLGLTKIQKGIVKLPKHEGMDILPLLAASAANLEELSGQGDEPLGLPEGSSTPRRPPIDNQEEGDKDPFQEAADRSDVENAVVQGLEKDGDFKFAKMDEDVWKATCRLFNCDINVTEHKIDGIRVKLYAWQMYAIYKTLAQITTGNASFMIGDDVGFGKTGMSLVVGAIFYMAHQSRNEVSSRSTRKHCSESDPEEKKCPSRKPGTIQCYCEKGGLIRQLADKIRPYPPIIMTPPSLAGHWVEQFEFFIDKDDQSPTKNMSAYVANSDHSSSNGTYYGSRNRTHLIKALYNQNERCLEPPMSGASTFVIVSWAWADGLMRFLREKQVLANTNARGRSARTRSQDVTMLGSSFIFFDEFHEYSGRMVKNQVEKTGPFQLLNTVSKQMAHPTVAVGLSGSCKADPHFWWPLLDHAFVMAKKFNMDLEIGGMKAITEFKEYHLDHLYLINHIGALAELEGRGQQKDKIKARTDRLYPFLKQAIPQIMIARTKGDMFRGQQILTKRQLPTWRTVQLQGTNTIRALKQLNGSVKSWITQEWDREKDKLTLQDRDITRKQWINQRMKTIGAADLGRGAKCQAFQIALRSSCFPRVAHIVSSSETINYNSCLATNATLMSVNNKVAARLDEAREGKCNVDDVQAAFLNSPWWEYRKDLKKDSPKIAEVINEIQKNLNILDMTPNELNEANWEPLGVGPAPPDGSPVRHTIVFADSPISTFLVMMVLFDHFRDAMQKQRIAFVYAHGGGDTATRGEYCRYIQENCTIASPCKVVVTSLDALGTGQNLFRASTVILTEIPNRPELQKQAFGRVDRQGQVQRPRLIQLYCPENLAEYVRWARNNNREEIGKVGQEKVVDLEDYLNGQPDAGPNEPNDDDPFV
ncbi:hypothetical protein F5Y18DRAFT_442451 [Xylariaceae sp. FL1019]|nr:hypothetical protein F5Y18DRAFT_442451 [Xylariaceae sp. FL1019]